MATRPVPASPRPLQAAWSLNFLKIKRCNQLSEREWSSDIYLIHHVMQIAPVRGSSTFSSPQSQTHPGEQSPRPPPSLWACRSARCTYVGPAVCGPWVCVCPQASCAQGPSMSQACVWGEEVAGPLHGRVMLPRVRGPHSVHPSGRCGRFVLSPVAAVVRAAANVRTEVSVWTPSSCLDVWAEPCGGCGSVDRGSSQRAPGAE